MKFVEIIRGRKIYSDSFWALSGNAVGKGLGMLAGIIIARMLGADLYGEFGVVKSTLAYVAIFSTFGLGYSATRFIANGESNETYCLSVIKKSILITLVTSVVMMVAMVLSASFLTDDEKLARILRYTSLIVIFNALNSTQVGVLAGLKDFKSIAFNVLAEGVVAFVLSCILTYFYSLNGAVVALLCSTATQCVLNLIAIIRHVKKLGNNSNEAKEVDTRDLIGFSAPIALQEGVFALTSWLKLFLFIKLADSLQLGLYSASILWFNLILFVPSVLRNVVLSHLSSTKSDEHSQTFSTMLKVNLVAAAIPAICVAALSYPVSLFYGSSFSGLVPVLLACAITSIFGCIANIYTQEFISRGKNWFIFIMFLLRDGGTVLILALCLLYGYFNSSAALMIYVFSFFMHVIYCSVLHIRYKNESSDY